MTQPIASYYSRRQAFTEFKKDLFKSKDKLATYTYYVRHSYVLKDNPYKYQRGLHKIYLAHIYPKLTIAEARAYIHTKDDKYNICYDIFI